MAPSTHGNSQWDPVRGVRLSRKPVMPSNAGGHQEGGARQLGGCLNLLVSVFQRRSLGSFELDADTTSFFSFFVFLQLVL